MSAIFSAIYRVKQFPSFSNHALKIEKLIKKMIVVTHSSSVAELARQAVKRTRD